MLFLYATYYDILIGEKSDNEFIKRYHNLEMKMVEDDIDIPYTINDLEQIIDKLYNYTLHDTELYFCIMTDKNKSFYVIKDPNLYDQKKIDLIIKEFSKRICNKNIDKISKL